MESSGSDDTVPIDGNFCMSTENICVEELLGDSFLARINNFRIRGSRSSNLVDVFGFDGVAENDAHRWGSIYNGGGRKRRNCRRLKKRPF